jgi:hypothetical protein
MTTPAATVTPREAMRILKRHLSNVVYKRMLRDLNTKFTASTPDDEQVAARIEHRFAA